MSPSTAGPAGPAEPSGTSDGPTQRDQVPVELPLLHALFEGLQVGVYSLDVDGALTGLNPAGETLLGYREEELLDRQLHELVHQHTPDGRPLRLADCPVQAVLRTGRAAEGEGEVYTRRDGSEFPVAWAAAPVVFAGEVTGIVVAFRDLSAQVAERRAAAAELTQAAAANVRLALLSEVTGALTDVLGLDTALRSVARLLVPELGDASMIDLMGDAGRLDRVAVATRAGAPPGHGLVEGRLPPVPEASRSALVRVLRGAGPMLISEFRDPAAADTPLDAWQLELYRELRAASAVIAPLRARGAVLGAVTVLRTGGGPRYGQGELRTVDEVARRVALAVDNARLFAQQAEAVHTLQRSLLGPPPAAPPLQVAARYQPAREAGQVGGDWYDVIRLPDGAVALVIGDVAGHDLEAAAAMSQLRSLLRGIALTCPDGPAEVVSSLDRVTAALDAADLVTLLYGRLLRDGGGWLLRWCNAGHPPPVLIDPAGGAELLDDVIDPPVHGMPVPRTEACRRLPPGVTLLLYTDGLVENRNRGVDAGIDRLRSLLPPAAGLSPGELCDLVLDRMAGRSSDDVAVLAVRLPG